MKKIYECYEKFAEWICSFTADRYVHLIVGLLLAYLVGRGDMALFHREAAIAFVVALIAVIVVGIIKEVIDIFLGKNFDFRDALFTSVGGVIGALLIFL